MESFWDIEIETAKSRAVGSLLGLAVGDALGTTLEFYKRDSLPPVSELVGGGHFRLDRGKWTDWLESCAGVRLIGAPGFPPVL